EVGDAQRGGEIQAAYTSGNDKLHMAYDFDLLSNVYPTGTRIAEVMAKLSEYGSDGWACWAYSNHDVIRHASRWNLGPEAQRVYAALLLSLRGTACLYQGEELGLTEAYVSFEELQDPYGKRFWPMFKGRDGCRTPMPWAVDQAHAGFSEGMPWLPVAMEHIQSAADVQEAKVGSMLNFYRQLISFRNGHTSLLKGDFVLFEADERYIAFERRHGNECIFCAFNLSELPRAIELPDGDWAIDVEAPFASAVAEDAPELPPWQALFATAGG
ncbi:MAG: alpha-amylase family glycosyl hydrolase, partial [Boseongicola sp.]